MSSSPLSARAFFRDPVGYVCARGNGAAVMRLAAGPSRYALVRDPDEIWRVLVSDASSYRPGKWKRRMRRYVGETLFILEGDEHRRRRQLLNRVFDRSRVAKFAPSMVERIERRQSKWIDGDRFALRDELDPLALTITGDFLLSTDIERHSDELARALVSVMGNAAGVVPPVPGTRQRRVLSRIERFVDAVIAEHRGNRDSGGDAVDTLLGAGVPEEAVRGELIAGLLAAVDEPTRGLEATYYFLGRNSDVESRMLEELDQVVGERTAQPDDLTRLPYLDAVIREALRLLPPTRHIDRCPAHPVEIGGGPVGARSNVIVSPLVTHHDPSLYERPGEFDPARWLGTAKRSRGGYLPFGAGPRACIGAPLARMIMTLTLISIGRRWRLRIEPVARAPEPGAPRLPVVLERR